MVGITRSKVIFNKVFFDQDTTFFDHNDLVGYIFGSYMKIATAPTLMF